MHSFSVEALMGAAAKKELGSKSPSQLSASDGIRTPSPSSSGNSTGSSPQNSVTDPDVVKALSELERQAALKHVPRLEKPHLSYIALISMAILSSQDKKLLLSDIYQWIMDNFQYYNNNEKAWRNSIRHNLSLNECFVKSCRSDNGKGHYWAIHPACLDDFARGDYRRRQARRRAKKNNQMVMGYMPTTMHFSPYAVPMYSQMPYYASPMPPLTGMPTVSTMQPLTGMSTVSAMQPLTGMSTVSAMQPLTGMSTVSTMQPLTGMSTVSAMQPLTGMSTVSTMQPLTGMSTVPTMQPLTGMSTVPTMPTPTSHPVYPALPPISSGMMPQFPLGQTSFKPW